MSICRIIVCHDCGCYIDIDKMLNCWQESFWLTDDWASLQKEYSSEYRTDQLVYELIYSQIMCRFLTIHHNHNIEILTDEQDKYYNILYINGNPAEGKALRETRVIDLRTESRAPSC